MSVKLKIKVSKEILEKSKMCGKNHIDTSKEFGVGANCAISLSIRDLFPDAWVYSGSIDFLYFTEHRKATTSNLPAEATQFIKDFDYSTPEERVMMPELEFEIDIPNQVVDQLNIDDVKNLLTNHPTLQLQEA